MPVTKGPGDGLFAGSIVEGGTLQVRATTTAADNTIARIIHLVEEAQAHRAPAQRSSTAFRALHAGRRPLAAAVATVRPCSARGVRHLVLPGTRCSVIACPCALVISTPVSIVAAIARATREGC